MVERRRRRRQFFPDDRVVAMGKSAAAKTPGGTPLTRASAIWYFIPMKLRMHLKISQAMGPAALVLSLTATLASTAHAQIPVPPGAAGPATSPPAPTIAPPPAVPPAPVAPGPGPIVELPPERDMPSTALPRETPIENPLGGAPAMNGTAVGGYGELTLNAPSNAPAVVDLRRFVLFVGHNFTDRIRFYSEVEVEHAVSSREDAGEVEIEQAYVDGLLGRRLNLRAGLILMPVGIINVYHEPPTFNGVDRPEVDTLVIPSTWREPGFGIFGELTTGVAYQLYVINGLNANGFTAEAAVADGHQEGMLAAARDFGAVGRLTYEPMLATILGVSGYFATSGNSLRSTVGNVPVGLWEIDARTRYRGFTARAELAMLFIGETAALNQALAANDPAASLPVAKRSQGAYLEAGYDLMRLVCPLSEQSVTLFSRFDYVNTQASVAAGLTPDQALLRYVITAGLVYRPIPQIALKGDYRRHWFGAGPGYNELAAALAWMF
jgi:hypothetical protein